VSFRFLAAALVCLICTSARAGEIPPDQRRSGYELMARETRAIQDDDTTNPGMLWVLDGEALWNKKAGTTDRACAACHGDARTSMKGVAARYPAFDTARGAQSIWNSASTSAAPSGRRHRRLPSRAGSCWR